MNKYKDKTLQEIIKANELCGNNISDCEVCPYYDDSNSFAEDCIKRLTDDTVELLKALSDKIHLSEKDEKFPMNDEDTEHIDGDTNGARFMHYNNGARIADTRDGTVFVSYPIITKDYTILQFPVDWWYADHDED